MYTMYLVQALFCLEYLPINSRLSRLYPRLRIFASKIRWIFDRKGLIVCKMYHLAQWDLYLNQTVLFAYTFCLPTCNLLQWIARMNGRIWKIHDLSGETDLTFKSLAVSLRTTRFNIQKFYTVLALRWVICADLRTDSDFCFLHN